MAKPSSKQRKAMRAHLYRAVSALWGCTERQFHNRPNPARKTDPTAPRYIDAQDFYVLAAITSIREACDQFERAYGGTEA